MSGWEVELDATAGSGRQAPRGPLGRGPDAVGVGGGGAMHFPRRRASQGEATACAKALRQEPLRVLEKRREDPWGWSSSGPASGGDGRGRQGPRQTGSWRKGKVSGATPRAQVWRKDTTWFKCRERQPCRDQKLGGRVIFSST